MTTSSPRCTTRACPVTYRSGTDRPCPMHQDDAGLAERMAAYDLVMAAPGEGGDGDEADQA